MTDSKSPINYKDITVGELIEKVKQMRHNQKRYRNNPTPEKLETVEKWEKEIDDIISVLKDTQMKLF